MLEYTIEFLAQNGVEEVCSQIDISLTFRGYGVSMTPHKCPIAPPLDHRVLRVAC